MRLSIRSPANRSLPPTGDVRDHADKLTRIPRLPHHEDERPSREDLAYTGTNFTLITPPAPKPRLLRRKRQPRDP